MNKSPTLAITATDLTKVYGERAALSHGSFEVPAGSICGFVGPNGSGKTTTIRMLLGLIKPTGGSGTVLGESINQPEKYLPRVGAMIEGPAFYPALSGRENLKVLAELGGFPLSRVDELLKKVDLADRGGSKFKTYSLGMKQRLGIAAALLPNPQLLILDEPTNGLDPSGIQEVRGIIRDLADSGTTVFVSSHILSELEMICEYLVMLREGKVIFSGRTNELLSAQKPMIVATPEYEVDLRKLADKISSSGHEVMVVEKSLHISAPKEVSAEINRMAFD
ncbi:MAG: ATP-binding cassette domain-containing protein, partial [Actinobacteria bacterium]|nr:ATP-binding cassette domain-containing protein [Actinomycetota bacterium]